MKREFTKGLVFLSGLVVLYWGISFFFIHNWNYPMHEDYTGMRIKGFEGMDLNPDIIFLGSSHVVSSVMPMKIYADRQIITYNLGTFNQNLPITNFFIEETFARGFSPKIIVLDAGVLFSNEGFETAYRYVTDNIGISANKNALINSYLSTISTDDSDCLPLEERIMEKLSWYFPLYRYHDRWSSLNKDAFFDKGSNYYFMQGGQVISQMKSAWPDLEVVDNVAELEKANQQYTKEISYGDNFLENYKINEEEWYVSDISEPNLEWLKKIRTRCFENNCELLLIKVPVRATPGEYNSSWTKLRYKRVKEISDELSIPYVDLVYDENLKIDWEHDTSDHGWHLNYLGAEKVTEFLEEYLCANYKLASCVANEYEEKLITYNELIDIADIELSYNFSEYIRRIKESKHSLVVLFSCADDISQIPNDYINVIKELGLQTDFSKIGYADAFVAIWDSGVVKYEGISNKRISYSTQFGDKKIDITSAGYLDGNYSLIEVNGRNCSMNRQGLDIVVLDKESGIVVDRSVVDFRNEKKEVIHELGDNLFEYQEYLLKRK